MAISTGGTVSATVPTATTQTLCPESREKAHQLKNILSPAAGQRLASSMFHLLAIFNSTFIVQSAFREQMKELLLCSKNAF